MQRTVMLPISSAARGGVKPGMPDTTTDASEVAAFIARWKGSGSAERANTQSFLNELCDLLSVPRPDPAKSSTHPTGCKPVPRKSNPRAGGRHSPNPREGLQSRISSTGNASQCDAIHPCECVSTPCLSAQKEVPRARGGTARTARGTCTRSCGRPQVTQACLHPLDQGAARAQSDAVGAPGRVHSRVQIPSLAAFVLSGAAAATGHSRSQVPRRPGRCRIPTDGSRESHIRLLLGIEVQLVPDEMA